MIELSLASTGVTWELCYTGKAVLALARLFRAKGEKALDTSSEPLGLLVQHYEKGKLLGIHEHTFGWRSLSLKG